MDPHAYRDLRLLTELSSQDGVTQRSLARTQGMALGLTNLLIRRLAKKGYVKIISLQRNRLRYLITPRGLAEKARLTYEYLEYSLYFYRQIRTFLTQALSRIDPSGRNDVLLYGTGEVAEIAFVMLQQGGFRVVAIVDGHAGAGVRFLNEPVRALSELGRLTFDRVVVASIRDRRAIVQDLMARGVAREKIIAIPDEQTPEFQAASAMPEPQQLAIRSGGPAE